MLSKEAIKAQNKYKKLGTKRVGVFIKVSAWKVYMLKNTNHLVKLYERLSKNI